MFTVKTPRLVALFFLVVPAFAQYGGPAILTRGDAPSGLNSPQIDFVPFLSLVGVYDTGLAGVTVNSAGQLTSLATEGVEVDFGISGIHSWTHTRIALNYGGAAREYSNATSYSGVDQSLMLGITQRLSRHVVLQFNENAGTFAQTYGLVGLSPTVPFDPTTTYTPTTDFFDNRTIYTSSQVLLTYQRTARLSLAFGGDWDVTRRRSSALYGVTGEDARADVQYRVTRRSTIGVNYMFTRFTYNGVFSGTDFHRFSATYGVQFSKSVEFSAFGGMTRVESKFPELITLDPTIAALLGVTQGYYVSYGVSWVPTYSGRLSKTFERGVAYLSGGRSMNPGNGLFLTSKTDSASAGYSYTGLRRWGFNMSAGWDRSNSIGNILGEYGDYSAGLSTSRQISHLVHMVASVTARKYQSDNFASYNHVIWDARVGLSFSPRDIPLRIW
ncbi:MAG: hypothetical protein ABSE42_13285 [Bryobacteraceae bacterium]